MQISKLWPLAMLVTACASEPGQSTVQSDVKSGTTTKIKINGFFDSAFLTDGDLTNGFFDASKDQIANTSSLDFAYSTQSLTNTDLVVLISGAGDIPNAAFSASMTAAHVHVTTPFDVTRCEVSISTGDSTCALTTPITFDLTWTKNGFGTTQQKTKSVTTLGPLTTKFDGTFQSATADVNGTWTDHNAVSNGGELDDTQSVTVTRDISMN